QQGGDSEDRDGGTGSAARDRGPDLRQADAGVFARWQIRRQSAGDAGALVRRPRAPAERAEGSAPASDGRVPAEEVSRTRGTRGVAPPQAGTYRAASVSVETVPSPPAGEGCRSVSAERNG